MRPVGVVADGRCRLRPPQWAQTGGLPLLEARDSCGAPKPSVGEASANTEAAVVIEAAVAKTPPPAAPSPTTIIDRLLRSGQQVYAKGDLVVLGLVSYGAEVIAEGNIHIYAPLRGRALAACTATTTRASSASVFRAGTDLHRGIYRTTENPLPADVLGKSVQIWLDGIQKPMIELLRLTWRRRASPGVARTRGRTRQRDLIDEHKVPIWQKSLWRLPERAASARRPPARASLRRSHLRGHKTAVIDFDVGLRNLDLIMRLRTPCGV